MFFVRGVSLQLPGVRVRNLDFFLKKHVQFQRTIKSALFKVRSACCKFSPFFEQLVNTTVVVFTSFILLRTIHRAIFSRLRSNQTAARQVCDPSMRTRGNLKEPSLVSRPPRVELLSRVLPTCRKPVLQYVMEKWLCVVSFGSANFWPFFKQGTVQIGQLLLETFSINRFPRF